MVKEAGLKLADISGSGTGGLIMRRDVEAAVAGKAPAGSVPGGSAPAKTETAGEPLPASGVAFGEDAKSGLGITGRTFAIGAQDGEGSRSQAGRHFRLRYGRPDYAPGC
nr:E3 binding domain-containing protein [Arthrobacter sp. H14]